MSNIAELPNPFTPMAFFPPDLAFQITIANYVLVGSLSVLIWDILMNVPADLRMLAKNRISIPKVAFCISRLASLANLLAITILQTSPVGHCENIQHVEWLYALIIPSTSLLFFFRVRALYAGNKFVVGFFFFMWLAVVGGSLTPTQGISGSRIGTTNYCIESRLDPYVSAACIIPLVNDTLVFLASSWRLMQNSLVDPTIKNGVNVMVLGRHLPAFSRAFLHDGQAYYLTTIILNLVTTFMFFNTSIPVVYRSFIGVPNIVLMNSMACHVYRKIKLGVYREFSTMPTNLSATSIAFNGDPSPSEQSTRGARSAIELELDRIGDSPRKSDTKASPGALQTGSSANVKAV